MAGLGGRHLSEKIALAKEMLDEAGGYLNARDVERAAWLIQEAERLVVEIAKGRASKDPDKPN